MIEIKAPQFPESIADGEGADWHAGVGESVKRDDPLVDIETDKVVLEVVAPEDGVLVAVRKKTGDTVSAEEILGEFEPQAITESNHSQENAHHDYNELTDDQATRSNDSEVGLLAEKIASPAAQQLAKENQVDLNKLSGSGKRGRITKGDVVAAVAGLETQPKELTSVPSDSRAPTMHEPALSAIHDRTERRVPMTRLRASIAKRLVEAQQTAAMLTTFNEIDMQSIMSLRSKYKDEFAKTHDGIRLGFMSFFIRASVEALKRFPAVNASIDGADIVYHGYQDIGVAVGSPRGLVVPVIRDADRLTLAELEHQVGVFGKKAQDGKLSIEEMSGGTFTISNGGVFGSLLSTPILNPPQTAILGMHKIQERPVVQDGEIVIRPMMYLALSYDHRLIDGQEAVSFLVAIKGLLEEPARILLDL
ncbi:MAG: 2-oxoglutarate dehydrogenase complex dihydrolipoyllysine-residue succinyltransferase [Pseudomonadota bacterium]|nr:2-oxoglutarate dehydrogenase complex dihydrolipoyllysine-residue succinyltransferase [Pseudomonadota bacterium]